MRLIMAAAIGGSTLFVGFAAWSASSSTPPASASWGTINVLLVLIFFTVMSVLAIRRRCRWSKRLQFQVEHTWLVHANKDEMEIRVAGFGTRPYERHLHVGVGTGALPHVWRMPKVDGQLNLMIGGKAMRSKGSVADSEGTAPSLCEWIPAGVDASLCATLSGKDRHRVSSWYLSIAILGDSSAPEFMEACIERESPVLPRE